MNLSEQSGNNFHSSDPDKVMFTKALPIREGSHIGREVVAAISSAVRG
jgi:hypothetical protein